MKNKYISCLLLVLLLSNFAFSYKLYLDRKGSVQKAQDSDHQHTTDQSQLHGMLIDLLMINSKMHYNNDRYKFPDTIVTDIEGNKNVLSSILPEKYKLVFKYSHKNCSPCIDTELNNFIEISRRINPNRLIILAEHQNVRELSAFIKERNISIPVYRIDENGLDGFMER